MRPALQLRVVAVDFPIPTQERVLSRRRGGCGREGPSIRGLGRGGGADRSTPLPPFYYQSRGDIFRANSTEVLRVFGASNVQASPQRCETLNPSRAQSVRVLI